MFGKTSKSSNQVTPVSHDGHVEVKQYGRKNGLSFPLHPLQVVGWFFIILFLVTHFAVLVWYLPLEWKAAGIIIPAGGFVIHFVYHILALVLDPADPAVRLKGTFSKGSFDREKHNHVIEDCFCYICQTKVSVQSKHCSVCNKCVAEFDHHCKWLNNCVGGRNYKLFLGSCISAFLTAFVMFVIDFYLMVLYYHNRSDLLSRSGNTENWVILVDTKCPEAFIIFDIVNALLLFIVMGLLGHLLIFHAYLLCHNMTTYEYIIQGRQRQSVQDMNSDLESACEASPPPPKTLDRLSSGHHGNYYVKEEYSKNSYELNEMQSEPEKVDLEGGRVSHASIPGEVINEDTIVRSSNTKVYETPDANVTETRFSCSGETLHENKKKRRLKHRSSSKVELLHSSDPSDRDDDDRSLSSITTVSQKSVDTELERYKRTKDEMVLDDFRSPNISTNRPDRTSRPTRLTEETVAQGYSRNESAVSRPRSPSPNLAKNSTERFKTSQSSLSTVNLIDLGEDGTPVTPRLSTMKEEGSSNSKPSSKSSKRNISPEPRVSSSNSRVGDLNAINEEIIYSPVNRMISPPQSLSSQISLSNARYSRVEPPVFASSSINSPVNDVTNEAENTINTPINSPINDSGVSTSIHNDDYTSLIEETNETVINFDETNEMNETIIVQKSRSSSKVSNSREEFNTINAPEDDEEERPIQLANSPTPSHQSSKSLSPNSPLQNVYTYEEGRVKSPVKSVKSSNSPKPGEEIREQLLSSPISGETKLTSAVPDVKTTLTEEKAVDHENENDLIVTSLQSEDDNLIFEDDFIDSSDQNNAFLMGSLTPINANVAPSRDDSGNEIFNPPQPDSGNLSGYVEAFKRNGKKQSSQFSYGSDSEKSGNEVPIATLNEETDPRTLRDSLDRVKKLSDAFPSALDQERLKKRSLPHPNVRPQESMAEITVVEFSKKKKFRKKRPGAVSNRQKSLPPLRGKRPLDDVSEEADKTF